MLHTYYLEYVVDYRDCDDNAFTKTYNVVTCNCSCCCKKKQKKKVYPKLIEGMSSRGYCSEIFNFSSSVIFSFQERQTFKTFWTLPVIVCQPWRICHQQSRSNICVQNFVTNAELARTRGVDYLSLVHNYLRCFQFS